ncbi:TetR/AcrR family transcriptional regulator [Streptomyces liangshanensis]|uniref:TetR family transcriptional regulator n=1 Tax=Streptomyces liangshanensis TaxID=2717324 RepID=A0A6G9H198_9ACTN|nr:TetR/AcrR family transcriptional regulator C-terminal domain-containing protein [Streptomyces liangshanensis]QIQ03907.1 TetR family transcriptional regulator [Streptomyces liangshanensis]
MASEADSPKRPPRTSVWLEGKPATRPRRTDRGERGERGGLADPTPTPTSASTPAPALTTGEAAKGATPKAGAEQPPLLDRDRITTVSVRLLDAEGSAKFSMRRLAAELGVTAMSLYWYVDTKDDLLELALDAVFGEVRVPELTDETADWRDQLRELAVSYRSLLVRHPWVSPLIGKYLNIGPSSRAFSSAVLAVMGRTGLAPHGRMGAVSAVFQFVYGFGTIEGHFVQRCVEAGLTQDEYHRHAMGSIHEQPDVKRAFENAEELMEARGGETVEEMRERDFTFALDLMIAGIEAMRERG